MESLILASKRKAMCRRVSFVCATLLLCGSCSDGRIKRYKAEGTVKYEDGTALVGATVVFRSDEHSTVSRGSTDETGLFRLSTFEMNDGAPAGEQAVSIRPFTRSDGGSPQPIHARYLREETSGLRLTIEPRRNRFDIVVEPP